MFRMLGQFVRLVARLVGAPLRVIWHVIMLPLDLAFLVFDAFWVNLRKTRIFGTDCRGRYSYSGGICPPARKYTNKALFRLICPEMGRSGAERSATCRAGERPSLRIVRAFFLVTLLGCGAFAALIVVASRAQFAPGEREPAAEVTKARVALGDQEFSGGRYREALDYYRGAARLEPPGKELIYKMGLCYAELREEDNATKFLAAAASGEDAYPAAVRRMAMRTYERGQVPVAGAYAARAQEMGIADGPMLAILADSLFSEQKPDEARPNLEAALAANPDSSVVKVAQGHALALQGDADAALSVLDSISKDSSVALLAGLYRLNILRQTEKPQQVAAETQALADQFPDLGWLSVRAVDTRFASGDRDEALKDAERLREKLSADPAAKLDLAASVAQNGYDALAVDIAEECAKDTEVGPRANAFMGALFLKRNMWEHARTYADRALAQQPAYVPALLLGARAAMLGQDADAAGRYLATAAEVGATEPAVWQSLGELNARLGDAKAAEEAFRKARELAPQDGLIRQQLGLVLQATGKTEEARTELLEAARLLANPMSAYTSLGMLAREAGDVRQAREDYLKAIQAGSGEAAVAANNLADLILSQNAGGPDRWVALALAYSAYVRVRGTRFEAAFSDTLGKALAATGLRAEQLGVSLSAPAAGEPAAGVTAAEEPPAARPPGG